MNLRRTLVLSILVCLVLAPMAHAASSHIVISQVYGGGGAGTGSPAYANDYIELFNTSNAPVVIGGWSVQYGSATGVFGGSGNVFTFPAGTTIPAGKYVTVKTGNTGTLGAAFAFDFTTGGLSMSQASGKVALVNSGTALGCGATATPCTLPDARIIDSVSYGASNNGEGGTTVNNGTAFNSTAIGAVRKSNGCQDTDNNNADFIVASTGGGLVPRTSAHAGNSCGVTNNAPAINAPANPIATVFQDAAPFTVSLTGNDDGGVYVWSATAGSGISSVNVTGGQGTANATFTVVLQAGFTGTATFTASLSDNVNPAATRAVNIQVNSNVPNDPPAIDAPANPIATVMQDAAPFAVSLSGSDDNNVFNWSATAGTGVSAVSVSGGQGTASATFTVTLQSGFNGTATFTASLSDGVNVPVTRLVNITVNPTPPPNLDHLTISQVYGGGGNSGATYQRDYVELFNATNATIDTAGWSIQYASATGSSWQVQPLGGPIQPGEYYLIVLATGGAVGAALPAANIDGEINMAAGAGKVALVSNGDPLDGACPSSDSDLVDLIGYGSTASCREGSSNAPGASNTTSLFRKNGGFTDTNVNGFDFVAGTPNPRRTAPIVEIGPAVLFTDPRVNASSAPRDANIFVTFTEPVDISGAWFTISCATTGAHNEGTVAGSGKDWIIVPNAPFINGETCTVTIFKDFVHDSDLDDSAPNTDTLAANYTFTFNTSTGTLPAYTPDVHLTMGNPSGAVADTLEPNNYLMEKPEFALSYNRDRGTPNWVSWHLADEWVGTLSRVDTFRADSAIPADWYRVLSIDYQATGFDRGHMVPNADRDKETSIPINQATFLMTNMIPQSPDNNQGPWADLENYFRTLLPANEIYIVAGGSGAGGTGSNGFASTIANGHVTVPSQTWKVALVLPKDGGDDASRVTAGARTIAVVMPNIQGIRNVDWETYLTTVDAVEALSGYDFFANVGDAVENAVEAGVNGVNPPGVDDSSASTDEDTARSITLDAVSANGNPLTFTIVGAPQHGTLSGTGANQTYTPVPDFNGTDTFTFRVSDGVRNSNLGTVTITVLEVNDAPAATNDNKLTNEDAALSFAASDLTTNDVAGPADELGQSLTVSSVTADGNTHGSVALSSGVVTYIPDANFNGAASFSYEVCDNGLTNGLTTPLCATATVSVTVNAVNDAPSVSITSPSTSVEGSAVSASITTADVDAGDTRTAAWSATKNGAPFASGSGDSFSFTPDDDGSYVVSVTVTDSGNGTGSDSETVAISNAAPAIAAISGPSGALALGSPATINLFYLDPGTADTHTATITWDDGSSSTVACGGGACTATRTYSAPGVYDLVVVVSDDDGGAATTTFGSVVVYDANGGFVTGGGFIANPAGGKGHFNFNPKYQKNAATPSGNTQFKTDAFDFKSTALDWLAVAGNTAQFQGTGTIDGAGSYGFVVTAIDGASDTFRIRIWNKSNGATVYDNGSDQSINGSIVIHAK